jgi:hypothetical protein
MEGTMGSEVTTMPVSRAETKVKSEVKCKAGTKTAVLTVAQGQMLGISPTSISVQTTYGIHRITITKDTVFLCHPKEGDSAVVHLYEEDDGLFAVQIHAIPPQKKKKNRKRVL